MNVLLERRAISTESIDLSLYENQYLTTEALESGNIVFNIPANITTSYITSISYRKNNGEWVTTNNSASNIDITVSVVSGDIIEWKGIIPRSNNINGTSGNVAKFASNGASFNLYGNLLSLFWDDSFRGKKQFPWKANNSTFSMGASGLFMESNVVDASNFILPVLDLTYNYSNSHQYAYMFKSCTSLLYAPSTIAAENIGAYAYYQMFMGCTSMTTMPNMESIEDTLGRCTYMQMFQGCSALQYGTDQTIHMNTATHQMCQSMFQNCTSLVNAPNIEVYEFGEPVSDNGTAMSFAQIFYGCSNLETPPERFDITEIDNATFYAAFANCTKLEYTPIINIRRIHFVNSTLTPKSGRYAFAEMFYNCTSLTDASGINIYFPSTSTWYGERPAFRIFYGCTNLIDGPSVHINGTSITTISLTWGQMFYNCQKMTSHDIEFNFTIDSNATVPTSSGGGMFNYIMYRCFLTHKSPRFIRLPLTSYEFERTFEGCTALTDIYVKFNTNSSGNALTSWLENCVGTSGTIHQAGTLSLPANSTSGVRSGWTLTTGDWTAQRHARMTMWVDDFNTDEHSINECYTLFNAQLNDFQTTITYGTSRNIYHYYGDTLTIDGVTYFIWENNEYTNSPYKILTTTDNFYELKQDSAEILKQKLQPSTDDEKLQVITIPFTHMYGKLEDDVLMYDGDTSMWPTYKHLMSIKRNQG